MLAENWQKTPKELNQEQKQTHYHKMKADCVCFKEETERPTVKE